MLESLDCHNKFLTVIYVPNSMWRGDYHMRGYIAFIQHKSDCF